jgi:hypothetical protein
MYFASVTTTMESKFQGHVYKLEMTAFFSTSGSPNDLIKMEISFA